MDRLVSFLLPDDYGHSPTDVSPREEMIKWPLARWTVGVITSAMPNGPEMLIHFSEWSMSAPFPSKHLNLHVWCPLDEWDGHAAQTGTPVVCGNGSMWIWQDDGSMAGTWLHFQQRGNFRIVRGVRE
jgi:hypothetical protein